MKLRHQILLVVLATVALSLAGGAAPPPPVGADLTFKIGWYVGHYVGVIENLFR